MGWLRLWAIKASKAAAEAPPAGRHGHPDDVHHAKKSSSTDSKPSLCSSTICWVLMAGSMAPSSTMARTWVGNIWA